MKVLHVITDTNIGGAGRYLLNLISQPAFSSLYVAVACPDGELGSRLDQAGVYRIPISGKDVSFSVKLIPELCRAIAREKPDVVHTHSSLSARIASRMLRVPVVYTKHNLVRIPGPSGRVPPSFGPVRRAINGAAARLLADKIIAVSEGVYRDLVESGINPRMVVAIPNGIDLKPFRPRLYRDGGAKRSEVVVGTVARLHPQKGLDVLVEAARTVVRAQPGIRFIIGGTGPMESELRSKIASARLDPYVKLCGFVHDVPAFLEKLDIYVLSSHYEGLPLAVLEAMAAGLPVIATNVGGVPEAVVDGVTGILVPPGQPTALAHAIVRLAIDPELAYNMGSQGRRRAEELFDARLMAERTVEVYRSICCPGRFQRR